jgi:hypothetical protein
MDSKPSSSFGRSGYVVREGAPAHFSSNTKQIFAQHSSEYIQFDEPETVIDAIREVCDQSK